MLQAKWFWFLAGLIPWLLTLVCSIMLAMSGVGWVFYLIIGLAILLISRLLVAQLRYVHGPAEMRLEGASPFARLVRWNPLRESGLPALRFGEVESAPKYPIMDNDIRDRLLKNIPKNHRVRVYCRGRYFYDLFTDINHYLYSRGYSVEAEVIFNSDGLITPDTGIVVGRDCTTIYLNSATQGPLVLLG